MKNNRVTPMISNDVNVPLLDDRGVRVSAHEGGILRFDDTYHWYGTSYVNNPEGRCGPAFASNPTGEVTPNEFVWEGFNVYTSKDLCNWQCKGKAIQRPDRGWGRFYSLHRPHVIYNESTRRFVMWCYYFIRYPGTFLMVAVADSPLGPFRLLGPRELGSCSGHGADCNVFKDADGTAYLVYDDGWRNLRVERLSDDYLTPTHETAVALTAKQEAPAMTFRNGWYIVAGSGVDGWNATETVCAVSRRPLGPYGPKRQMSRQRTWGGQITDFVYVPESECLIALCDRWWQPNPKHLDESGYLWLPVRIEEQNGEAALSYLDKINPMERTWVDNRCSVANTA
jgi:hypothetical protein